MTGDDYERLGEDAERLVTWIGNEAFMTLSEDAPRHCAALELDSVAGTFLCSVYETRPQVCRDLERGGPACLGELEAKRGRPAQALVAIRRP